MDYAYVDDDGRHRVPDPEVADLADELIRVFQAQAPKYTGKPVRVGVRDAKHFYRAALRCRESGHPAETYIEQQLEGMAATGCFWPSAIASEKLAAKAVRDNDWCIQKVRHYRCQLALIQARASIYGLTRVLRDPAVEISPLIRCIAAHREGLTDVEELYIEAARTEYNSLPIRDVFNDDVEGWLIVSPNPRASPARPGPRHEEREPGQASFRTT